MKENTLTAIEQLQEATAAAERLAEIKQEIAELVEEGSPFRSLVLELEKHAEAVNQFTSANKRQMDILEQLYSGDDLDSQSEFIRFAWNLTPDTVKAVTGGAVKYTQRKKNRFKGVLDLTHEITIGEFCVLIQATLFDNAQTLEQPPEEAAELYREALKEMRKEILEPKTKPKKKKALNAVTIAEAGLFSKVGSGPALDVIMQMLATKGDPIRSIGKRGGKVMEFRKSRTVELDGKGSTVKVEISDIDKLEGSNAGTKKMFVYLLEAISSQSFHYGTLHKNFITFSVNDLVQRGLYSTYQSAVKGFKEAMEVLTSFKVQGSITKGRNTIVQNSIAVLFTGGEQKNGVCTVYLNERIDWGFATPFQMGLPAYYYKLKNKPSDLLYLIFFLARQNAKEIKNKGSFTISLRVVQDRMGLPNEKEVRNARRDILDVIEAAVEAIENESKSQDFTITMELKQGCGDIIDCNVQDILEHGQLRIAFKKEYASKFLEIAEKTKEREKKAAELNEARKRKTLHD